MAINQSVFTILLKSSKHIWLCLSIFPEKTLAFCLPTPAPNQWFPEFLHSPNSKTERTDVRDSFTDFIGTQHRLINNDTEETEPQGQNGEAQNLAIYRYEIYQAYLVFNMASVQNIILSSIKTKLEKLILTFCDQRRSSTYSGYITFVNILSNIVKVSISEKYNWINGIKMKEYTI